MSHSVNLLNLGSNLLLQLVRPLLVLVTRNSQLPDLVILGLRLFLLQLQFLCQMLDPPLKLDCFLSLPLQQLLMSHNQLIQFLLQLLILKPKIVVLLSLPCYLIM